MSPAKRTEEEKRRLRESLLEHAARMVAARGPAALTMRALANDAGCAVGLPYKVFASREDLVSALILAELDRLRASFEEFVADAGAESVAENLDRFARLLLDTPAIALSGEIAHDEVALRVVAEGAEGRGFVGAMEAAVESYLAAEKRLGRVRVDVDEAAFAFVITGAVHNLLVSPSGYPRPTRERVEQVLAAVAAAIGPVS
ncbi:TetR/AcrR family transcriptional regulator [Actinokineospora sp. HUAS TT18]|uniref:TetR/AcrR family transcriptional regulator n=1 Tax=Actinokineospora sp. HUAS TT18 TaxID=3447451 RepID=UPI003F525C37